MDGVELAGWAQKSPIVFLVRAALALEQSKAVTSAYASLKALNKFYFGTADLYGGPPLRRLTTTSLQQICLSLAEICRSDITYKRGPLLVLFK